MLRAKTIRMAIGAARSHLADLGFLDVPAQHGDRGKGLYRLRFARFPARQGAAAAPVLYLFGGPSPDRDLWRYFDAGREQARFSDLVDTVTAKADLVVVDHRGGLGCVFPRLTPAPITEVMPFDRGLSLDEREYHWRVYFDKQIEFWARAGIDLATLRTTQLAQDLEQLRIALGYDRIRLCADSNGTYRAREYLRQFQPRVESALFFIAHGYQKLPAAASVRAALGRIEEAVADDPVVGRFVPCLTDLLDELTARLDRRPVRTKTRSPGGAAIDIELDGNDLAMYVWTLFKTNQAIREAPGKLWDVYRHADYAALAAIAARARMPGAGGADAYAAAFAGSSMPNDREITANQYEAGASPYLNRQIEGGESSCAWPLPRDEHSPFAHSIPITYVQGAWDIRCPLEGVEAVAGTASRILVNPAMGHNSYLDGTDTQFWEKPILDAWLAGDAPDAYAGFPQMFDRSRFTA